MKRTVAISPFAVQPTEVMERHQPLLEEVAALLKGRQRDFLTLPDLFALVRRGNVALPVDPTHLGCLWVLDR